MRGFKIVKAYIDKNITLPERKTKMSAGYDIAAADDVIVPPRCVRLVPTGLKAYMGEDEYLGIHIRSSLAIKKGLSLINGQGIIDADYYDNPDNEGHIMLAVVNFGELACTIKKGERVAQGIFYKYLTADGDAAEEKRTGGFGSTGK
jgi:dUTP pyrophosphatase